MIRIIVFLLVFILHETINAQQKKALVVAIGNYPVSSGFRTIHSTHDIPIIQNALIKLGFKESDIHIIQEKAATKKNIVDFLAHDFINSLHTGDIAFFHFSGHGQQVIDHNGDELDGLDEAIVPYDASLEFLPGMYEGQNHITDDELRDIFSKIRTKLGPKGHLLTTIDACHSGTSTRHIGSARGTDIPLAPSGYNLNRDRNKRDLNQSEYKNEDETKMASMVAFFGSMANQLNYEIPAEDGKSYGSLSYAFSKAFHSIPSESSYQQLFDRIRLIIQMNINNQIPEASGILAQAVLGGKYLGTPNYFTVKEWQNKNTVMIEAGFLNGITPGTVMGFYPPEMRSIKNAVPIAVGTIKISGASTSIVEIPEGISSENAEHAWVMVKEENFGDLLIHLQLKGNFKSIDPGILDHLFSLPYVKQVDSFPDLVLIEDNKKLFLVTAFDLQIAEFSKSVSQNDLMHELKSALTQYGQSQYLRKLTQENKQIALEFEFILIKRKGVPVSETFSKDSLKDAAGNITLKEGDVIKLKVTNAGTKPAYFSFLDIQPDNRTNVLFPLANESPADYYLEPGKSFTSIAFQMQPPLGQELFKLIATKNPINLRPLDQRRSISSNFENNNDPFEKLIKQSYYNSETRMKRGMTSSLPAGLVNIYSVAFVLEE